MTSFGLYFAFYRKAGDVLIEERIEKEKKLRLLKDMKRIEETSSFFGNIYI